MKNTEPESRGLLKWVDASQPERKAPATPEAEPTAPSRLALHLAPRTGRFRCHGKRWDSVSAPLRPLSSLNQKHRPWAECVGTSGQLGGPAPPLSAF